jgi:hypothetical protein
MSHSARLANQFSTRTRRSCALALSLPKYNAIRDGSFRPPFPVGRSSRIASHWTEYSPHVEPSQLWDDVSQSFLTDGYANSTFRPPRLFPNLVSMSCRSSISSYANGS